MRALLVEDEALVALIAEEALAGLGFQVHAAATAAEALEAFEQERPDLAVIDIGASGMVVREALAGLSEGDLRRETGAPLAFAPDCRPLEAPPIALSD